MKILKAIAFAAASLAAIPSWSQSFDCAKAGNLTEQTICANENLATDDEVLGSLYRSIRESGLVNKASLQVDQRAWVRERNKCGSNVRCIAMQYEIREGAMCDFNAPEGRHPCYKSKDEAWEAAQPAGAGKISEPSTFEALTAAMGSEPGGFLASSPKIQPDGALYHLHGKIAIPIEGKAEFFALLSASEENQILADTLQRLRPQEPRYFYVKVPKAMQAEYYSSARVNAGFDVVGRYTNNVPYNTALGQQKIAPVFTVERIFMWESKNNPFKQKAAPK